MAWFKKYRRGGVLLVLLALNIFVWTLVYERRPSEALRVYLLDVGQGDAILIDSPNHARILIDGGRNRKVLSELGRILPFADRRLDVVLATHPDSDHIGGLPAVLDRYNVGVFVESGVADESSLVSLLTHRLEERGVRKILARRGLVFDAGDGTRLTILFPNQDVSGWNSNDASIVAKLVYGETSFLFTGDATVRTENILLRGDPSELDIDVLKAGHHGSRTSTSLAFVQATTPEYALISAGRNNSYGHPHKEVIDTLTQAGSLILSTVELGTIEIETQGQEIMVR